MATTRRAGSRTKKVARKPAAGSRKTTTAKRSRSANSDVIAVPSARVVLQVLGNEAKSYDVPVGMTVGEVLEWAGLNASRQTVFGGQNNVTRLNASDPITRDCTLTVTANIKAG